MNPVFLILVIFAGIALWFLLSGTFCALGAFFRALWDDAKYNMEKKDKEKKR